MRRVLSLTLTLLYLAVLAPGIPAGAVSLFSDGFEGGSMAQWTATSGLVAQQQEVFAGSWGARGTTTGAVAYAYKTLTPAQAEVFYSHRFKVISQGTLNVSLVRFRTSSVTSIFSVMRKGDGKLHYYNEVTGVGTSSPTTITTGVWHLLEVHGFVNGASSLVEVRLDGSTLISKTDSLGTTAVGRVYLGDPGSGKPWDIAFDDVVVANTSSDPTPPTVPTGLTAVPAGSNQVDLAWSASTDNVAVTGYTVYRDGAFLATVGTTTFYSDATAAPSTTYSYTVDAFDAAGNHSAQSSPASATTPGVPDTTPPSVPTGLAASPASPARVDLSWSASTDNVGVAGYEVFRNGMQIGSTAATSFADGTVAPGTTYTYTVRAFDGAGNRSAFSLPAQETTPQGIEVVLEADADTYVSMSSPQQ